MSEDTRTTVESIKEIEAGDVLTVERKGEVVADKVEITEINICGFSGAPEPQTDGEIDHGASLHDLLAEALGSNSQFTHHFAVYTVEQGKPAGDEGQPETVTDDCEDTTVDEHTVELNGGDDVTLNIGDKFENTDDGRRATIEDIRQEPLNDSYDADYDTRIKLSFEMSLRDADGSLLAGCVGCR